MSKDINENIDETMLETFAHIDAKYWGKQSWIFLNVLGLSYNPEKKQDYMDFFSKLANLLPCSKCSSHYKSFLPKLAQALKTKSGLIKWLLEIRNDIDVKMGKKPRVFNDIIEEIYFSDTQMNIPSNYNISNNDKSLKSSKLKLFMLVCVIFIMYRFYKKYTKKNAKKNKHIKNKAFIKN